MMINEATIEEVLELFDKDDALYEESFQEFAEQQPELLQYIVNVPESVLTAEESDYLLQLAIIIWKSVNKELGDLEPKNGKAIELFEEKNWKVWETSDSTSFNSHLDAFFQNTDQEDLLAFVEDSLTMDEEDEESTPPLTKEGLEPMFIALKTFIDVLTKKHS